MVMLRFPVQEVKRSRWKCIRRQREQGNSDQATAEQLQKRIQLLERWRDRGYDGKR